MATFEFIDNGKSFNINFNGQQYTAGKSAIELVVSDDVVDEVQQQQI